VQAAFSRLRRGCPPPSGLPLKQASSSQEAGGRLRTLRLFVAGNRIGDGLQSEDFRGKKFGDPSLPRSRQRTGPGGQWAHEQLRLQVVGADEVEQDLESRSATGASPPTGEPNESETAEDNVAGALPGPRERRAP
jgi:hypothetical protein